MQILISYAYVYVCYLNYFITLCNGSVAPLYLFKTYCTPEITKNKQKSEAVGEREIIIYYPEM